MACIATNPWNRDDPQKERLPQPLAVFRQRESKAEKCCSEGQLFHERLKVQPRNAATLRFLTGRALTRSANYKY